MKYIILFDFGSTFTKATVVCVRDKAVVYTTKRPSTVKSDATVCLNACLADIRQQIGEAGVSGAMKLASSSAAGGLRMAVCGLTESLSIAAGRNVSFGAGAKIVHITSGELGATDLKAIADKDTEIILLCGGYEGGSETALVKNAETIAAGPVACPVIFAGNSRVAKTITLAMARGNKEFFLARNVIPDVGKLDAGPAEAAIRHLFMQRIVNMKGLDKVRGTVGDILMPTPAAVLGAGELLSRGTAGYPGIGELMIVDIGGATTDIHSYAEHRPFRGARCIGAAEPYVKRTVEGDLGMRESSDTLCTEAGYSAVAGCSGLDEERLRRSISHRVHHIDYLPDTEEEQRLDRILAHFAVRLASRRHCGRIERVVSNGCNRLQTGKNLSGVGTVVGTGGILISSDQPVSMLRGVFAFRDEEPDVLLPENASVYLDQEYVLYAAGLLRTYDEDLAYVVAKNSMAQW